CSPNRGVDTRSDSEPPPSWPDGSRPTAIAPRALTPGCDGNAGAYSATQSGRSRALKGRLPAPAFGAFSPGTPFGLRATPASGGSRWAWTHLRRPPIPRPLLVASPAAVVPSVLEPRPSEPTFQAPATGHVKDGCASTSRRQPAAPPV